MLSCGVAYMALSALGFSAMAVFVKLASAELPTGEIVLVRASARRPCSARSPVPR